MREADRQEVWAINRFTAFNALTESVGRSVNVKTALVDNKVLAIFGIGTLTFLSRTAVPWVLTSNEVEKHRRMFLQYSKWWIEEVRKEYPLLVNIVDGRYIKALKWLKWLGFEIGPALPLGVDGALFHRIEMRT